MRAWSLAGLMAGALALSACISIRVPEGAYFYPETRLAAEKMVLPPGLPLPAGARTLALRSPVTGRIGATLVDGAAGRPLILFCGGNLFRRAVRGGQTAADLAPFGSVMMFDYPGYGDSEGEARLDQFDAAVRVVAGHARDVARSEGRRLVFWGHSLGGPVCAEAAREFQADALVLQTTTASARAAVNSELGLLRPLARVEIAPALGAFDIVRTLDGYPGRVVVLEAGRDGTLKPALSRALARDLSANGVRVERLVFAEAGHNDVPRQADFTARLTRALAGL